MLGPSKIMKYNYFPPFFCIGKRMAKKTSLRAPPLTIPRWGLRPHAPDRTLHRTVILGGMEAEPPSRGSKGRSPLVVSFHPLFFAIKEKWKGKHLES